MRISTLLLTGIGMVVVAGFCSMYGKPSAYQVVHAAQTPATALTYKQVVDDYLSNPGSVSPDKFSWEIFAVINTPVAQVNQKRIGLRGGTIVTTNDVTWEQWADNVDTFPSRSPTSPILPTFPEHGPSLPVRAGASKKCFKHLFQDSVHAQVLKASTRRGVAFGKIVGPLFNGSEEVRRNRESFNYIATNRLWTLAGILKMNQNNASPDPFSSNLAMPQYSIEVKAQWQPCTTAYPVCHAAHFNYDSHGNKYALVGLHVMTKVSASQWVFSSWEWAGDNTAPGNPDGNPGRCNIMGCIDSYGIQNGYGVNGGFTKPISTNPPPAPQSSVCESSQLYPPGSLTQDVQNLLSANNVAGDWQNYRLKVTQVNLDNPTPAIAGNSQIEHGYIKAASCITCHGKAGADHVNGNVDPSNLLTEDPNPAPNCPGQVGPTGPRQAAWFMEYGNRASYQVDYVWSFLHVKK